MKKITPEELNHLYKVNLALLQKKVDAEKILLQGELLQKELENCILKLHLKYKVEEGESLDLETGEIRGKDENKSGE